MEASRIHFAGANYRFLQGDQSISDDPMIFDLDESDVWNSAVVARTDSPEIRKSSSRISMKPAAIGRSGGPASLPVNVPDWSKILKGEYRENLRRESEVEYDEDVTEYGDRIPPHEFLARQMARTRIASFSVYEGIGRTLKGRDLSRVRNAIWQKIGFED